MENRKELSNKRGHTCTNPQFRVLLRPLRAGRAAFSNTVFDLGTVLSIPKLKNAVVYKPRFPMDRRHSPRLNAHLEAELVVSLSLLDTTSGAEDDTLVLLGVTHDVSTEGLAVVVPAIRIDEDFCEQGRPLNLSLQLDTQTAEFTVQTIHCIPLKANQPDQGYLIGTRITDFGELGESAWRGYLNNLSH